ncbi:MAG: hypothetical protein BWZ10_03264 [candidate division BRC1 bacterium ADurb.BinA364]|nr:MAG: hypothetical protein BWZ10_03264 [candidate division BRC1 bacterium ADurb.BinA364]
MNPPSLSQLRLYCTTTSLQLKSMCTPQLSALPRACMKRFFSISTFSQVQGQMPLPRMCMRLSTEEPDPSTVLPRTSTFRARPGWIPGPPMSFRWQSRMRTPSVYCSGSRLAQLILIPVWPVRAMAQPAISSWAIRPPPLAMLKTPMPMLELAFLPSDGECSLAKIS